MRKLVFIGAVVLAAACGVGGEALAGGKKTPVSVVTEWGSNDPQVRVVHVTVDERSVTCIEAREQHGGGFSDNPVTAGISISCDWAPK